MLSLRNAPFPSPVIGSRWLPLSKGLFALIDEDDYIRVSPWYWSSLVRREPYTPYAMRRQMGKTIYLHRFITRAPFGLDVDHINGNGLDCRKENLRICTHAENQCNYSKTKSKTASKFKGVHIHGGKWYARIKKNGKTIHLGTFDTQEQAAHIYDRAAVLHFGKYARLNFPMEGLAYTRQMFRLGLAWVC